MQGHWEECPLFCIYIIAANEQRKILYIADAATKSLTMSNYDVQRVLGLDKDFKIPKGKLILNFSKPLSNRGENLF